MTTKLSKSMAMSLALGFSVLVTPNAQSAPTKAIPAPANQKNAASKKIDFAPVERDILQAKFGAAETKLKAIMTSSDSLHALHLLGLTYLKQQRLSDAELVFQKAIDSPRKSFGDKSPAYAQALADMASLYALKGDLDLAWKNKDEALANIEDAKGNNYLEKA